MALFQRLKKLIIWLDIKMQREINLFFMLVLFLELDFESYNSYKNVNIEIINPYEVLGLKYNSSDDDIKRAYKKLVIQFHPDRFTNEPIKQKEANEKFIRIRDAYEKICRERNLK